MTPYELYVFILCLIVFIALVALCVFFLTCIFKLAIRLIRGGTEDERIKIEYLEEGAKRKSGGEWIGTVFSLLVAIGFLACLGFTVHLHNTQNKTVAAGPQFQVVKSDSMATKYEKNNYLFEHGLNNQIDTFDLILTHQLPDEQDLKLYDVVVYEAEGTMVVHRIVGIEEPNETHPNERYFRLQGDAVKNADRFPVLYSQMRGIYRNERIPFVGSLIIFLQSPAGLLCTFLVIFAMIATPILEKKLENERKKRLAAILQSHKALQLSPALRNTPLAAAVEDADGSTLLYFKLSSQQSSGRNHVRFLLSLNRAPSQKNRKE